MNIKEAYESGMSFEAIAQKINNKQGFKEWYAEAYDNKLFIYEYTATIEPPIEIWEKRADGIIKRSSYF